VDYKVDYKVYRRVPSILFITPNAIYEQALFWKVLLFSINHVFIIMDLILFLNILVLILNALSAKF
jgi:hypothetical protein